MNYFNQLLKVCAALGRHVRVSGCEDAADREEFLIEHLGVPVAWIAEAKAARAKREGNHKVGVNCQVSIRSVCVGPGNAPDIYRVTHRVDY